MFIVSGIIIIIYILSLIAFSLVFKFVLLKDNRSKFWIPFKNLNTRLTNLTTIIPYELTITKDGEISTEVARSIMFMSSGIYDFTPIQIAKLRNESIDGNYTINYSPIEITTTENTKFSDINNSVLDRFNKSSIFKYVYKFLMGNVYNFVYKFIKTIDSGSDIDKKIANTIRIGYITHIYVNYLIARSSSGNMTTLRNYINHLKTNNSDANATTFDINGFMTSNYNEITSDDILKLMEFIIQELKHEKYKEEYIENIFNTEFYSYYKKKVTIYHW